MGNDRQFARLCEHLGAEALLDDPRFADNGSRSVHRQALKAALEGHLASHDGPPLAEALIRLGVPCGAVATVDQAIAHPHTRHREMLVALGDYRGIASPVKLSRTPAQYRSPPPGLGQHSRELLEGLGLDAGQVDDLIQRGIVRG